jgi:hypothetical protein
MAISSKEAGQHFHRSDADEFSRDEIEKVDAALLRFCPWLLHAPSAQMTDSGPMVVRHCLHDDITMWTMLLHAAHG